MKKLLTCALGASLGLLSSAAAADPVPPTTPAAPTQPAVTAPPASGQPASAPTAASAADQLMAPGGFNGSPEVPTPADSAAAPGSLLDLWLKYYDEPPRNVFSADALVWWIKAAATPPLAQATPPSVNGFRPNGGILIGGEDLDEQQRYGGRVTYTRWFDRCSTSGIELIPFVTGDRHASIGISSLEFPNLSRPFISNNPGLEGFLAKPVFIGGDVIGLFSTELNSEFWGAEINFRRRLMQGCNTRIDGIVGLRYLNLDETLTLTEETQRVANDVNFPDELAGSRAVVFDRFATDNDFYGGQFGANFEYRYKDFSLDIKTMFAFGATHEKVSIEGTNTRFLTNGQTLHFVGGMLALDSNIGTQTRNVFAFVPQVSGQVSYYPVPGLRLFGGYDFLYWSRVARAGEHIDITLDATRIPRFAPAGVINPAPDVRPAPIFKSNDFWAQGVSFGAELRW